MSWGDVHWTYRQVNVGVNVNNFKLSELFVRSKIRTDIDPSLH